MSELEGDATTTVDEASEREQGEVGGEATPGASAYVLALREQLARGLKPVGSFTIGDFEVEVGAGGDSVWAIVRRPGRGGLAIRAGHATGGFAKVRKLKAPGARLHLTAESAIGTHRFCFEASGEDLHLLRVQAWVTPERPLLVPFLSRDLYPLGDGGDPLAAMGRVEAAQRGPNTGLIYLAIDEPAFGHVLYPTRRASVSRAYAEFVVGPQQKFYVLPDHVGFDDAALLDTFAVCLHAQHLSGLSINDKVAIIGAGPIGLGQLMLAKASGADVLIIDPVAHSREVARELGADIALGPDGDAEATIGKFTGGRGADIVFECAGGPSMPDTLPLATKLVRRGGKLVLVGGFDEGETTIPLEWQRIQMSEITLILSASFAFHDLYPEQAQVLDLVANGKLKTRELITHRFPLDEINKAFDTAQLKQETGAIFICLLI